MGYTEEELYSRSIDTFLHPDDLEITSRFRDNIIEGTPLINFENRYLSSDGSVLWFSWTSVPDSEQQLVYAIAKNITHKKKLEEDRNSLITKLTQSNKKLKELTFTTSHDLRSPVNNLLSLFSIFNASDMEKSEILEFIDLMQLSTEGLKNTLDGYVDNLSQKDVLTVAVGPLDMERVLKKVVNSIKSLIEASNTQIRFDFSACREVNFNEAYLESICLNMLTNSIKYSRPGVSCVISIYSRLTNGMTQMVFEDNGIGFDMEKIGEKVFGFRETFHTHADSKGIGLYLVHNHITALGGKIEIDSSLGEGARFTITFRS